MTRPIFLTSDTHFGSQRHLEYLRRPFKSVQEMDFEMITNWNLVVPKDALVYHLGDWGDFYLKDKLSYMSLLNGEIILIEGNYDRNSMFRSYGDHFKAVHKEPLIIHDDAGSFKLVHEPMSAQFSEEFVLFGHITGQKYKRNGLNVCVDVHGFKPISWEDVLRYRDTIENWCDEEVFFDLKKKGD